MTVKKLKLESTIQRTHETDLGDKKLKFSRNARHIISEFVGDGDHPASALETNFYSVDPSMQQDYPTLVIKVAPAGAWIKEFQLLITTAEQETEGGNPPFILADQDPLNENTDPVKSGMYQYALYGGTTAIQRDDCANLILYIPVIWKEGSKLRFAEGLKFLDGIETTTGTTPTQIIQAMYNEV